MSVQSGATGQEMEWLVRRQLPGRVRLFNPELQGAPHLALGLEHGLLELAGVSRVRASAVSGTVLVEFDPTRLTLADVSDAVRHAHRVHRRAPSLEAREVRTLRLARERVLRLDERIRKLSGNRVDVRRLAMVLLTVRAALRVAQAGALTLEGAVSSVEVLLTWILFRHPRLERELERLEESVSPGV